MKKFQLLHLLIAIGFILSSCADKKNENKNTVTFESYNVGATYALLNTAEIFDRENDITFNDSLSLVIPSKIYDIDLCQLRDSIISYALDKNDVGNLSEAIKESLDNTVSEMGYEYKRINHSSANPEGFSYTSGFVAYFNSEMLVYCISTDSYNPGAAHGMSSKRYINFYIDSKKSGHILSMDDIFTEKGMFQLPDKISERAQLMSDIIGPTSVAGLPENNNFFISSEGQIVFVYQPYELASYSQGIINISFEPYELIEQMSPTGIDLFGLYDLEKE